MATPRVLILRAPGANCDGETAVRLRDGRRRRRARPHQPPARAAGLVAALPDPRHARRLHLRRRRGGRQDPRQPAELLPRRRPAAFPRRREAHPRHLQRLPGAAQGRPARSRPTRTAPSPRWPTTPPAVSRTAGSTLQAYPGRCPFLTGIDRLHVPIAHGEGRFLCREEWILQGLEQAGQMVLQLRRRRRQPTAGPTTPTARRATWPACATPPAASSA